VVTIPLAPRTARAIDLAIGERTAGPVFLAADGRRLDRHGAGRVVRKVARRAGTGKAVTPHTLRHAFITAALPVLMPGSPCATCKRPRHMLIREPRSGTTGPAAASTGMPPTSSPRMSRAPPGSGHQLEQALPGGRRPPGRACRLTMRSTLVGDAPRSQREREPPLCTRRIPSVRSAGGAQNGIFCRVAYLLVFWRIHGEVQQSRTVAPVARGMRWERSAGSLRRLGAVLGADLGRRIGGALTASWESAICRCSLWPKPACHRC
jgi:hypothetical protein